MKRSFLSSLSFFLVFVFVLACGGGGGGDGSTTGTAPRIENVVYYRLVDGNPQETSEAWVGDKGTFILSAWDPDKDITHMVVDEYHPVDATTPYRSRTEQVPSQSSEYIDLTP